MPAVVDLFGREVNENTVDESPILSLLRTLSTPTRVGQVMPLCPTDAWIITEHLPASCLGNDSDLAKALILRSMTKLASWNEGFVTARLERLPLRTNCVSGVDREHAQVVVDAFDRAIVASYTQRLMPLSMIRRRYLSACFVACLLSVS